MAKRGKRLSAAHRKAISDGLKKFHGTSKKTSRIAKNKGIAYKATHRGRKTVTEWQPGGNGLFAAHLANKRF
jgi:hypothetical protein